MAKSVDELVAELANTSPSNIAGIDSSISRSYQTTTAAGMAAADQEQALANKKAEIADQLDKKSAELQTGAALEVSTIFSNMQSHVSDAYENAQTLFQQSADKRQEAVTLENKSTKNPIEWLANGLKSIQLRGEAVVAAKDAAKMKATADQARAIGIQNIQDATMISDMQRKVALNSMQTELNAGLRGSEANLAGYVKRTAVLRESMDNLYKIKIEENSALTRGEELNMRQKEFDLQTKRFDQDLKDRERAQAMEDEFARTYVVMNPGASDFTGRAKFQQLKATSPELVTYAMAAVDAVRGSTDRNLAINSLINSGHSIIDLQSIAQVMNIPELNIGADFLNRKFVQAKEDYLRNEYAKYASNTTVSAQNRMNEKQFRDNLEKTAGKQIDASLMDTVRNTFGQVSLKEFAAMQASDYNYTDEPSARFGFLASTDPKLISSQYKVTDPKVMSVLMDPKVRLELDAQYKVSGHKGASTALVQALKDEGIKNAAAIVARMTTEDATAFFNARNPQLEILYKHGVPFNPKAVVKDSDGGLVDLTNPAQLDNYTERQKSAFRDVFKFGKTALGGSLFEFTSNDAPAVDSAAVHQAVNGIAIKSGMNFNAPKVPTQQKKTSAAPKSEPPASPEGKLAPAEATALAATVSLQIPAFESLLRSTNATPEGAMKATVASLLDPSASARDKEIASATIGIVSQNLSISATEAAQWLLGQRQFLSAPAKKSK